MLPHPWCELLNIYLWRVTAESDLLVVLGSKSAGVTEERRRPKLRTKSVDELLYLAGRRSTLFSIQKNVFAMEELHGVSVFMLVDVINK